MATDGSRFVTSTDGFAGMGSSRREVRHRRTRTRGATFSLFSLYGRRARSGVAGLSGAPGPAGAPVRVSVRRSGSSRSGRRPQPARSAQGVWPSASTVTCSENVPWLGWLAMERDRARSQSPASDHPPRCRVRRRGGRALRRPRWASTFCTSARTSASVIRATSTSSDDADDGCVHGRHLAAQRFVGRAALDARRSTFSCTPAPTRVHGEQRHPLRPIVGRHGLHEQQLGAFGTSACLCVETTGADDATELHGASSALHVPVVHDAHHAGIGWHLGGMEREAQASLPRTKNTVFAHAGARRVHGHERMADGVRRPRLIGCSTSSVSTRRGFRPCG